jgi:hypothetical protein
MQLAALGRVCDPTKTQRISCYTKGRKNSCDPVFSPLISEIPEDCQDLVKEVNFQERFKDKARLFLKIKKSLLSIFKKSDITKITLKLNWLLFFTKTHR